MKHIYRIQNLKGESCYKWDYLRPIEKILNDSEWYYYHPNRPGPHQDNGINRYPFKHEICDFKNIRQALKWFRAKEIKQMKRLGFDLIKVPIQKITAVGEYQVLAIKK